jgi:hypothetical protein
MNANSRSKHTFHYHASAHALSGQFWRPFQRVIEVQAPSVLPSIGGVGKSRVENFRLDDFVSFKAGYTHVLGSEMEAKDDKGLGGKDTKGQPRIAHTTQVTATVEELNILDVVTADRVVARLTSSHGPDEKEARIRLIGSKFENLRIAGCKVDVKLHHELLQPAESPLETFEAVKKHFENGGELRKMAEDTMKANLYPETQIPKEWELPNELALHGALVCSIVKEVDFKYSGADANKQKDRYPCPGVERHGRHMFHVLDFGRVYLAEVRFEYGRKSLTMLRVQLGSPNGAALTVVQADSNGRPIPP